MNTMQLAHKNASYGVTVYGGTKAQYFSMALKLAHKGVDLQAIADEKAKAEKQAQNKTLTFCFFVIMFTFSVLFIIAGEPENVKFASIKTALNAFGCLAVYHVTRDYWIK